MEPSTTAIGGASPAAGPAGAGAGASDERVVSNMAAESAHLAGHIKARARAPQPKARQQR